MSVSAERRKEPKVYDYIKIGSFRSDSVPGLHVLDWEAPLIAPADYAETQIPGRMTAISDSARSYKPAAVTVNMALVGTSELETLHRFRQLSALLWQARHLILSDLPEHHFRGHVAEISPTETVEEWLRFRLRFRANPPCRLRALGAAAGWIPDAHLPIPEQITETNASYSLGLRGDGTVRGGVDIHDGSAPYPPEVYMLLIGSWDSLTIGGERGLTIPGLPVTSAVWLDTEAMQVYDKAAGIRTPVPNVSGDYEAVGRDPNLQFSAINPNLTAHILVIERS